MGKATSQLPTSTLKKICILIVHASNTRANSQASAVSTFKLPLSSSSTAQQSFTFTMAQKGPNPSRQDAPHPHEVVTDPTGQYLLAPDLGADMIRIWSINQSNGMLTSCPSFNVTPGTGPRHATFWVSPSSANSTTKTVMYLANELANTVTAFSASYPSGQCITFSQTQDLSPFPNNATAPYGTKVAEVHVRDNFLYNANRVDKSFSGNDSLVSWTINSSGAITMQNFTDSYGTYPRTFSISPSGDFIAIGDQTTSNVVIVKRNSTTGTIGDLVANLRIASAGHPENEDGLSSVVWAD
jgi:6-phosphogluconolactonase (cycloisomerase 2 family)